MTRALGRGTITGLSLGVLAALVFRLLAPFEVPLAPQTLFTLIAYLFLARGFGETAALYLAARPLAARVAPPHRAAALLAMACAFGLALASDPYLLARWIERPARGLVVVGIRPLLAAGWIFPLAKGEVATRAALRAGWWGGLMAVLDRESGWATGIQALFAVQLAMVARKAAR